MVQELKWGDVTPGRTRANAFHPKYSCLHHIFISTLFICVILKNGKAIYQKAFGKANLESDVNLTPENVFQLGSMTKQFTAIAVLMLEEQGKLNVTDPISRYIAGYPAGNKITIHHLLTHTSGIKDFTKMKSLSLCYFAEQAFCVCALN